MSLGTYPASTAARDAPTAAFSLSASSYNKAKFSPFFNPLPVKVQIKHMFQLRLVIIFFVSFLVDELTLSTMALNQRSTKDFREVPLVCVAQS